MNASIIQESIVTLIGIRIAIQRMTRGMNQAIALALHGVAVCSLFHIPDAPVIKCFLYYTHSVGECSQICLSIFWVSISCIIVIIIANKIASFRKSRKAAGIIEQILKYPIVLITVFILQVVDSSPYFCLRICGKRERAVIPSLIDALGVCYQRHTGLFHGDELPFAIVVFFTPCNDR